ncbi:hypothetical protein [Basfia succiniciproducens]|uniref:hypothetical protein n=1 Tax=Basfia succiniciproducens TaxID=653940 RepID=UPI0008CA83F8|nr:hypothetical protein [Basfia succiniciproducens]SEQ72907.1 hypothetical protein SAMN02910415_01954 [Basfia succiniciproducens]
MEVVFKIIFVVFYFFGVMSVAALPFPYPLFVLGAVVFGCLYWIYRIVSNANLTRAEKWDRLLGRTW